MTIKDLLIIKIIGFVILSNIFIISMAQDRKELEDKKKRTIDDIEYTNELIKETEENRKQNINQVRIVNSRITLRNQIIHSLEEQVELLKKEINETVEIIEQLGKDYDKVKDEYSKLIYYAYWNKNNYNRLMFFLSADNFNQAYKRMKYLQQLTKFRKKQTEKIKNIQKELLNKADVLEGKMNELKTIVEEKEGEKKTLEKERIEKERIIANLKKQESKLRTDLRNKEEIRIKVEREITALIEEERKRSSSGSGIKRLTPEEQLISDNFEDNKGRLPWPTERGIITNKFGKHAHAVLPGIIIENNGIDITTVEGTEVRALYDGTVTRIIPILGTNYAVIVRHGEYLTVYQNLVGLNVKKGDKVKTKQKLGLVGTDKETNETILHLELWKELEKQNPENWISK